MADGGSLIRMSEADAERYILELLRSRDAMTTKEIEEEALDTGIRCPDQTVLFLSKLRVRGLIPGVVSKERRGWVWSSGNL